jgi:hypothetical protein
MRFASPDDDPEQRWTLEAVENRLDEAVATLKRLPVPDIQRSLTRWPGFVRDSHEAYGYGEFRMSAAPASPQAITRLDETLCWLRWLPRDAQSILWSRANGLSWRRIGRFAGRAPNTCRAWYLAALHHIVTRLNGAGRRPVDQARAPASTSTHPPASTSTHPPASTSTHPPASTSTTNETPATCPASKPAGTATR